MNEQIQDETRKFVTPKSIIWFIIALIAMAFYFLLINVGLMKVQGLDFFYLWTSGSGGAG